MNLLPISAVSYLETVPNGNQTMIMITRLTFRALALMSVRQSVSYLYRLSALYLQALEALTYEILTQNAPVKVSLFWRKHLC